MSGVVLLLALVVAAQGRIVRPFKPCPDLPSCVCSDSKLMVMACDGAELSQVPTSAHSGEVAYLALSDNRIGALSAGAFSSYPRARAVYLSNAGARTLHRDAFVGASSLEELDLSYNPLVNLHPDTFAANPRLRSLLLIGDQLLRLPDNGPFLVSSSLAKLDLSYCGISALLPDTFSKLPGLRYLDLASNKLTTLPVEVLRPLPLLEDLQLEGNEWECGCGLHELLGWTDVARGRPVQYRAVTCLAGNDGDLGLWSLEEQGLQCATQTNKHPDNQAPTRRDDTTIKTQQISKKTLTGSKPEVISVSDRETTHKDHLELKQMSGIKIFNSPELEIFSKSSRQVEKQKSVVEIEVEGQAVGSAKPGEISLGSKETRQQVTAQADHKKVGSFVVRESNIGERVQEEDRDEQSSLMTTATFEIIFIVVLACLSIAVVILAGLLLMYAFSAGHNVYQLMRSDSQDSDHNQSPRNN